MKQEQEDQKAKALSQLALILNKGKQTGDGGRSAPSSVPNSGRNVERPKSGMPKKIESNEIYTGVNQVLVYNVSKAPISYYVPCYIRMKVNRVSDINYIDGQASIEADVRLWTMIQEFPPAVRTEIINNAKLTINGSETYAFADILEPSKLDPSYKKNVSKNAQGMLICQEMQLDIESDPFCSPFETVNLISTLQIKKILLGENNPDFVGSLSADEKKMYQGAYVEFNFMDAHPFLQFAFGEVSNLGSFDIAESQVDMQFTADAGGASDDQDNGDDRYFHASQQGSSQHLNEFNEENGEDMVFGFVDKIMNTQKQRLKQLKNGEISPDAYEHGRILIPLYKYPATTIINLFVPFYMVAILSLGVFFQANDMSNRSASLATFQLAYIAFFPTVRETLPETPKLVFTQILIYVQATVTLICFFYSLKINGVEGYVMNPATDVVFLICCALTAVNIGIVIGLMLVHKCKWEPEYNKLPDGAIEAMQQTVINTDDTDEWWNPACEKEFKMAIHHKIVKPMFPKNKLIKAQ